MNRRNEKRIEADTREARQKLLHLLFACSKEHREWVESEVRSMNLNAANPLIFCTKPVLLEGAA